MQRLIRGFYSRISPLKPIKLAASERKKLREEYKQVNEIEDNPKFSLRDLFYRSSEDTKLDPPIPPASKEEVKLTWGTYYDDYAWMHNPKNSEALEDYLGEEEVYQRLASRRSLRLKHDLYKEIIARQPEPFGQEIRKGQ
mmetsp:Transcript_25514/g.44461  ORF Transcript_25514/g.44461 Transcript_25514/m.44461 type:complete len:140 (-) Transcript_25514:2096-2515(-)